MYRMVFPVFLLLCACSGGDAPPAPTSTAAHAEGGPLGAERKAMDKAREVEKVIQNAADEQAKQVESEQ